MRTITIRQEGPILCRPPGRRLRPRQARAARHPPLLQRAGPRVNELYSLGLFALMLAPPFQTALPNPFCSIFAIFKDWLGGIIILSVVGVVVGLLMRQFAGDRFGHNVTTSIFGIAGGIFILGLLITNDGAGITAIAQALGLEGITISCPAP